MKKFLAVFEAPCVGTSEEIIHADTYTGADFLAWERSVDGEYYVAGGYDLYEIVYNRQMHAHVLVKVIPAMMELEEVEGK